MILPDCLISDRLETVFCVKFYAYRLMMRTVTENFLHRLKNLFNQYCIDMMTKMITERLNCTQHGHKELRAEKYESLRYTIYGDANIQVDNIDQRVILPSFTGSPRYVHKKMQVPWLTDVDMDAKICSLALYTIYNNL